jgi:hypothetical protein
MSFVVVLARVLPALVFLMAGVAKLADFIGHVPPGRARDCR